MRYILLFIALYLFVSPVEASKPLPADQTAARIMVYFTVGRDDAPATNVTLDQFKAHLKELQQGDYNVLSLDDIFKNYKANQPLPKNTVAITFDGGDKSILQNAVPLLKQYQFPYTVFIATDRAEKENTPYLNWQDIRKLKKSGLASFGLHPEHYYSIGTRPDVSIRSEVNNATARFREETGFQPTFFAYPFGEYTKNYKDIISAYGFTAAFGQQSGVVHKNADLFTLPRFTMTENYANQNRFEMTANALPLPTMDMTPNVSHITNTSPAIGFTVPEELSSKLSALSCFASGQDQPRLNILGNRVELRLSQPIDQTRFRVNCTLPAQSEDSTQPQRWRWFGTLFTLDEPALEPEIESQTESIQ